MAIFKTDQAGNNPNMNQFLCETLDHNVFDLNNLNIFHTLFYKVNNRKGLKANLLPNINVKQSSNNQDICYVFYKLLLTITQ